MLVLLRLTEAPRDSCEDGANAVRPTYSLMKHELARVGALATLIGILRGVGLIMGITAP